LEIQDGKLVDLSGDLTPPDPGIPLASDVFLTDVNFHFHSGTTCAAADQSMFGLGVGLTGGPDIDGASLVGIDGDAAFYLPDSGCDLPARFVIDGTGSVFGFPVAEVSFEFDDPPATVKFGAQINLNASAVQVSAAINGGFQPASGSFFMQGTADISAFNKSLFGVDMVGSNVGLGACASFTPLLNVGAAITWADRHLMFMLGNCDVSFLIPKQFDAREAQADAPTVVSVPARVKKETFIAFGQAHAPTFTLTGPHGVSITPPTAAQQLVQTPRYTAITLDGIQQTAVTVNHPAAGS